MLSSFQDQLSENNVQLHFLVIEGTQTKTALKYSYDKHKSQKPKRNKSAFLLFSSKKRAQLKAKEGKNLNSNEIMAKLADLWNNLPVGERRNYEAEAKKDKERYLREMEAFKIEHPSAKESHNRTKSNHVKKPCSAYGLFLKEATIDIKKDSPKLLMADVLKIVSQRWRNLSQGEKLKYQEQAKKEKELSQAKLGYKLLQSHHIDLETIVNQTKEKQLEKVFKKVKRDVSDTISTNSQTQSLFTSSYEQDSNEDPLTENNFKCINYDTFEDGLLSPRPLYSEFELEPIQIPQIQQPISIPQTQEWNLPTMPISFSREASKEGNGSCELPNLLDNFRSSSQLYMNKFNEEEHLIKIDDFGSVPLTLPELSLSAFPSLNGQQDFSIQGNWTNSFQ